MVARNATLIHAFKKKKKTRRGGTGHRAARCLLSLVPPAGWKSQREGGGGVGEVRKKEKQAGRAAEMFKWKSQGKAFFFS